MAQTQRLHPAGGLQITKQTQRDPLADELQINGKAKRLSRRRTADIGRDTTPSGKDGLQLTDQPQRFPPAGLQITEQTQFSPAERLQLKEQP